MHHQRHICSTGFVSQKPLQLLSTRRSLLSPPLVLWRKTQYPVDRNRRFYSYRARYSLYHILFLCRLAGCLILFQIQSSWQLHLFIFCCTTTTLWILVITMTPCVFWERKRACHSNGQGCWVEVGVVPHMPLYGTHGAWVCSSLSLHALPLRLVQFAQGPSFSITK